MATDQICTIIPTFRDRLFTAIFPGRAPGAPRARPGSEYIDLRQVGQPCRRYRSDCERRVQCFAYEELLQARQTEAGHPLAERRNPGDSANLPEPDVIAAEIAEDLQAALDQFTLIATDLKQ